MKLVLGLIALLTSVQFVAAQENKVLLDNERVKVIYTKDRPGDKTAKHSHKDTVVIPLSDQRRRVTRKGEPPDLLEKRAGQSDSGVRSKRERD